MIVCGERQVQKSVCYLMVDASAMYNFEDRFWIGAAFNTPGAKEVCKIKDPLQLILACSKCETCTL